MSAFPRAETPPLALDNGGSGANYGIAVVPKLTVLETVNRWRHDKLSGCDQSHTPAFPSDDWATRPPLFFWKPSMPEEPKPGTEHSCSMEESMDPEQQHLVRASFAKVAPIADTAAAMFYDRLFATDPTLRSMFKGDMAEQGRLLMTMIETAVENVHRLDQILPAVHDLGRRHAGYGVKAADYDTVAAALLGTLEHALGSEFTPAARDAWVAWYQTIAGEMKAAAPV